MKAEQLFGNAVHQFVSDEGVWGCFVACGTKGITFIKGKMKPEDFESIL